MSLYYDQFTVAAACSSRGKLIDDIFQLECNVLTLRGALNTEQAKIINADLDSYYKKFVENQLPLMYGGVCGQLRYRNEHDRALTSIMDIGEKVQNKVIHIKTILNKFLDTESNRSNSVEATKDELNSLFEKQKCIIERIESSEPVEHDMDHAKAEISKNYLTSLYQLFISNQLEIEKRVSSVELSAQLDISKNIHQKVMFILTNLNKLSKTADHLAEPVEQSNTVVDLCELFETRGSLISQIESLEMEKFENAAAVASLNNRLTEINDSFTSAQIKIESLVRGADAQHKQLEIGKKIRQKVCTLRECLEEESKSLNSTKTNMLEALIKMQEAMRTQIDSLEIIRVDNEAEAIQLSNHLLHIYGFFTSNQAQIDTLVRGTDAEQKQLEIAETTRQQICSLRERNLMNMPVAFFTAVEKAFESYP